MLPRHTRATITGAPRRPILKVLTLDEFVRTRHEPEDCAIWNDASETLHRSRALSDVPWGAVISPTTGAPLSNAECIVHAACTPVAAIAGASPHSASLSPSIVNVARTPVSPNAVAAQDNASPNQCIVNALRIPAVVAPGDVIRISERNSLISVLYRRGSPSNALLVTERCNSYCIMCSQPPIERDDSYRVQELLQVIRLVDADERVLGITGGEPTLLGTDLIKLLASLKSSLPTTRVHILTNGRRFNDPEFARQVVAVGHDATVLAIPLYSDTPAVHDYVVQRQGAFDETLRGLLNLARLHQRIELRVVIQRATVPRLPQLAHFIARNLTFVDHVAWMGLEPTGFARPNWKSLWIEPEDYTANLEAAVTRLDDVHMTTSIYNVPLCALPERLHRFAARSISDWKNNYLPECDECSLRPQCGGFFASATRQHLPRHIRPVPAHVTTSGAPHG